MPINLYIYAAILAFGVAIGGTAAYKIEHSQVVAMELKISDQKIEAAKVLAAESQRVAAAEESQRISNETKDKQYDNLKKNSAAISSDLNNTINGLRFTRRGESSGSTTSKGDNPTVNTANDSDFTYISRGLLKFLETESARADAAAIDKNRLLQFVIQDNCGIPR